MAKVNFTKEHFAQLSALAGAALINGTRFKGNMGTEMNIYDLFHNTNITTLTRYHGNIKKEIAEIEGMDEWSLTEHQQRKATNLKKQLELVFLLIGYQRNKAEVEANAAKLRELKATYAELKESTKTPEDRLKEAEAQIAALEAEVVAS